MVSKKNPGLWKTEKIKKNKKAWIRIVEVFVAISLIMSVLLIVLNKEYPKKEDISAEIYEREVSILREVQVNNTLRNEVLQANPLPVKWNNFNVSGLGGVKNKTILETPNYLICNAQVCNISDICVLDEPAVKKDVYAQSIFISANLTTYNPRQLKLFCWTKK